MSDGTTAETDVVDISPPNEGYEPRGLTYVGGRLYWQIAGMNDWELWTKNGLTGESTLLRTYVGGGSGILSVKNEAHFMVHHDGSRELWSTDGSAGGTNYLTDLPARSAETSDVQVVVDTKIFFTGNSDQFGDELYVIDTSDFEKTPGDFDQSGTITPHDFDMLFAALGGDDPDFDINRDGQTNEADVDALLNCTETVRGDTNLDGQVDFADFLVLSSNFGTHSTQLGWEQGDFNGDQAVNFSDFLILSSNFGFGTDQRRV